MAHEAAIEASGSAVHGGSANAQGRNHIIGRGRLCDARATGVVYSELLRCSGASLTVHVSRPSVAAGLHQCVCICMVCMCKL